MKKANLGPPQSNWFCLNPKCHLEQHIKEKSRLMHPMDKCPKCGSDNILDLRMDIDTSPPK